MFSEPLASFFPLQSPEAKHCDESMTSQEIVTSSPVYIVSLFKVNVIIGKSWIGLMVTETRADDDLLYIEDEAVYEKESEPK